MSKHAHVFNLALDPSFGLCGIDDLLGNVFHSNLVPSECMDRHWLLSVQVTRRRSEKRTLDFPECTLCDLLYDGVFTELRRWVHRLVDFCHGVQRTWENIRPGRRAEPSGDKRARPFNFSQPKRSEPSPTVPGRGISARILTLRLPSPMIFHSKYSPGFVRLRHG